MNEFQKRYTLFDNQKLLKIIEEAQNYQPIAVEAAKLELSKRAVSNDEIQAVKDEILAKKTKVEERQKRVKNIESKAKGIRTELFKTITPIQHEPQTIDRKVNLIAIVFGCLAIYQIFNEFGMVKFMLTNHLAEWDLSTALYIIPLFLLPIGVFLFWKRNKIGWILMCAFFTHRVLNAIGLFFLTWKSNKETYKNDYSNENFEIVFQELEHSFSQSNPFSYLLVVLAFGTTLWVFNKEDLRDEFKIDLKIALTTIGISILIASIMIRSIL